MANQKAVQALRAAKAAVAAMPDTDPLWHQRRRMHARIRNILFNELGLSKQTLDNMLIKIASERVEALLKGGLYDMIERRVVERALRYNHDMDKLLDTAIKKTVDKQVAQHLEGRLQVNVSISTDGGCMHGVKVGACPDCHLKAIQARTRTKTALPEKATSHGNTRRTKRVVR